MFIYLFIFLFLICNYYYNGVSNLGIWTVFKYEIDRSIEIAIKIHLWFEDCGQKSVSPYNFSGENQESLNLEQS